ncbi:hypothetical protein CAEBREN_10961 [Caenorhabditis brenneri]|uniref:Uncharacterized protein n=1 Tax=Caenorhabditis brenneri TaxID=135651 RepID=G0PHK4_CAEBE|nr:hypothetical protein CAEBREN_10961 [Caenorhabditis brenneri]
MDHILLTKDDQQEPGMQISSDSFQGDPSDFLPTSARLAIDATAATISDCSALFSQIHGPNSLFDNGSLLAPQTVDIHQDDFKDFLNFHQSNLNDDWMQIDNWRKMKAANINEFQEWMERAGIRSSLFNQHKPGFPQAVWNTATVWLLFKTFHTNSGVKNDQGFLDKMWDEIREEKGSEYWGWIKRASDLKDEQLRQRELGFVVKNVAKERKSRRTTGGQYSSGKR